MTPFSFADKVYAFTVEKSLFSAPCHLIVGVSGGADSMSLLHTLCDWPVDGLRLTAVHIHHGLRGEAADRDAAFVQQQCQKLGVPLRVMYTDVAAVAASLGCGVEEAGRRERYRLFDRLREELEADYILTAHHADDHVETVLMHLLRGCGTDGLCGIPAVRGFVRRPLLCCSRQEIEEYCRTSGIPYVTDETNGDPSYTRNRVRHQVLPLLRQLNPSVDTALRRLAEHSGEDSLFLQGLASDALHQARLPDGSYATKLFILQPTPVRRRMLYAVLEELCIPSIEEKHLLALDEALLRGSGGAVLPTGLQISVAQGKLFPVLSTSAVSQEILIEELPVQFAWQNRAFCLKLFSEQTNVHKKFLQSAVDYDKIQGDLRIRCRREGDTLHPVGRGCGKTLKKLMNEWKIPASQRDFIPLVCDEAGIVLIPGFTCDERVRVTEATKHFLVWCNGTEQG